MTATTQQDGPPSVSQRRLSRAQFDDTVGILDQVGRSPLALTRLNAIAAWGELIAQAPEESIEKAIGGLIAAALRPGSRREHLVAAAGEIARLDERWARTALEEINRQAGESCDAQGAAHAVQLFSFTVERLRSAGKLPLAAGRLGVNALFRLMVQHLSQASVRMSEGLKSGLLIGLLLPLLIWIGLQTFEVATGIRIEAAGFLLVGAFGAAFFASVLAGAMAIPSTWLARRRHRLIDVLFLAIATAVLTLLIYLGTQIVVSILGTLGGPETRIVRSGAGAGGQWWRFELRLLPQLMLLVGFGVLAGRGVSLIPVPVTRFNLLRMGTGALVAIAAVLGVADFVLPGHERARWIEAAVIAAAAICGAMAADRRATAGELETARLTRWAAAACVVIAAAAAATLWWPARQLNIQTLDRQRADLVINREMTIAANCRRPPGAGRSGIARRVRGLHVGEYYPIAFCPGHDLVLAIPSTGDPDEILDLGLFEHRLVIVDDRFNTLWNADATVSLGLSVETLGGRKLYLCFADDSANRRDCEAPPVLDYHYIGALPAALRNVEGLPNLRRPTPDFFIAGDELPTDRPPDDRTFDLVTRAQDPAVADALDR